MAGNRIYGAFKSYNGTLYELYIYDAEFVAGLTHPFVIGNPSTGAVWGNPTTGTVWGWSALDELQNPPGLQTHKVGLPGLVLEYDTSNEKVFSPLMPSRLTFKLMFEDSTQETFLNALANSYEGQFLVRVLRDGNLWWSGVLTPDVVQYEDQYYPYEFSLTAIDGLARLQRVEYDASFIGGAKETLLEILFNCLGNLETNGFYDADDNYFVNNVDWWESRHVPSFAVDPLALTRIRSSVLYDADPTGEDFEFFNCYKVLEQICTVFGARLFHADGKWWMQQVSEYAGSQHIRRIYSKAGTLLSFGGVSHDVNENRVSKTLVRSNGRFEFLPPLRKATITYKHRSSDASLLTGAQWTWETDGTVYNVGEIGNNGGAAKMKFRCTIEHTFRTPAVPNPPDPDVQPYADPHYFRIQLKVGSYYLSGSSVNTAQVQWTTTPSFYTYHTSAAAVEENYVDVIEFITPPLPDQGTCTISLEYHETLIYDDTVIPAGTYTTTLNLSTTSVTGIAYWTQYSPLLVVLADGNETETINFNRYIATNSNTGNTATFEATVYLGDGPTATTLSALETFDGSTWAASGELWGPDTAGSRTKKILELLAQKIVETQSTPKLKYVGQLTTATGGEFFEPYNRLKIGNRYYMFMGGVFEANPDQWTNIHLFNCATSSNIVAPDIPTEDSPVGTPPVSE